MACWHLFPVLNCYKNILNFCLFLNTCYHFIFPCYTIDFSVPLCLLLCFLSSPEIHQVSELHVRTGRMHLIIHPSLQREWQVAIRDIIFLTRSTPSHSIFLSDFYSKGCEPTVLIFLFTLPLKSVRLKNSYKRILALSCGVLMRPPHEGGWYCKYHYPPDKYFMWIHCMQHFFMLVVKTL